MRRSVTVRQAIFVGAGLVVILGASAAARSDAPLQLFAEYLLIGLPMALLGVGTFLAIKRLRARRPGEQDIPSLNVGRAAIVGLIVGVLIEAALSAGSITPLSTFLSNFAFVLWVALLVALGMLAIERLQSRPAAVR